MKKYNYLRLPETAQNVLIGLYGTIIGLGLITNTAILLAFFKNKVKGGHQNL